MPRRLSLAGTACIFALVVSGTIGFASADGLPPEESLKHFKVAEGMTVNLFAAEPQVRQPVSMYFDPRGRLWVLQYLQYPSPEGLKAVAVDQYLRTKYDKLPEPPPKGPRGADRLSILEDTDGDGHADRAKDFITGLNLASGFAVGNGGVFVVQPPYLLFYPDRNGDDVPDGDPEVLLTGFGMEDAHAMANSLQWGPDGWLYGAQGSTVTAHIRGVTFQQGVWRYHPRTKAFELFAEGGGNTWGLDFDRQGQVIAGTNYGGVAMLHQVQGAYYVKNFGKHGELQNPYAFGYFEHVPYTGFKGGHVTCGGIVYHGGSLSDTLRDQYIAANLLSNAIYWHKIEPQGSTFINRFGGDLLTSSDQRFRPVDCAQAPDGSVFVADWYDQRANHVDPKDDWDKTTGRIYRISAKGAKTGGVPRLDTLPSAKLIELLGDSNGWIARTAREVLSQRHDTSTYEPLKQIIFSSDSERELPALWTLYAGGGLQKNDSLDAELAIRLLGHASAGVREWTVRFIGDEHQASAPVKARLVELAQHETDPRVRVQLACSAKRLPPAECLAVLRVMLLDPASAKDPSLPLLLWWAMESKAGDDRSAVLELLSDSAVWNAPVVQSTIVERIARRYAASGGPEDFAACARLLAISATTASTQLVVRGMDEGLQGKRLEQVPEPLKEPLTQLWSSGRPDVTLVRLALRLGSTPAQPEAVARIADAHTAQGDRLALLDLLAQVGTPECVDALLTLLAPGQPGAVQTAAMAALERFPDPKIGATVLKGYSSLAPEARPRAIMLLCRRAAWATLLLEAVDAGKLPPAEVKVEHLRQLALLNDKKLNDLAEKHWGKVEAQTAGAKFARVHGIMVSLGLAPGDAARGHVLFTKTCAVCHQLFGEGNRVGPDLTGADRKNVEFLLTSMVDPSAVIRKEYFSYTAQTTDGRVLVGLLAESTPDSITLLDAKNQRIVLSRKDVEQLERSPVSLMPERQLDELDAQQVRDLVKYLQSDAPPAK